MKVPLEIPQQGWQSGVLQRTQLLYGPHPLPRWKHPGGADSLLPQDLAILGWMDNLEVQPGSASIVS